MSDFYTNLTRWYNTYDATFEVNIKRICSSDFQASDQVVSANEKKKQGIYDINSYFEAFRELHSQGTIVVIDSIKSISLTNCRIQEHKELTPVYVAATLKGKSFSAKVRNVCYIKDGKLAYIGDAEKELCTDCLCPIPFKIEALRFTFVSKTNGLSIDTTIIAKGSCDTLLVAATIKSNEELVDKRLTVKIKNPLGKIIIEHKVLFDTIDVGTRKWNFPKEYHANMLSETGTYTYSILYSGVVIYEKEFYVVDRSVILETIPTIQQCECTNDETEYAYGMFYKLIS